MTSGCSESGWAFTASQGKLDEAAGSKELHGVEGAARNGDRDPRRKASDAASDLKALTPTEEPAAPGGCTTLTGKSNPLMPADDPGRAASIS